MATASDIEDLLRQLGALEDLEVLLWLRRRPGEGVDRAALAVAIGVDAEVVNAALDRLAARGLAARDAAGRWRYSGGGAIDAVVARVEELLADDRAAVLKIMSDQALERIRRAVRRRLAGGDGDAR